jgi:hypothetical protein
VVFFFKINKIAPRHNNLRFFIYFYRVLYVFEVRYNPNLESLLKQAREWRERGILKNHIIIVNEKGKIVRQL